MKLILQPEGSSLCGQCCVAMAAGVSLKRAKTAVGHERGTHTSEVVAALRILGVSCADRLRRVRRANPVLPQRAIIAIHRPASEDRNGRAHWMLHWDGKVFDPGGRWPDGYQNWRITSYLEIF